MLPAGPAPSVAAIIRVGNKRQGSGGSAPGHSLTATEPEHHAEDERGRLQLTLTDGLVVEGAAMEPVEFALSPNAQVGTRFNPRPAQLCFSEPRGTSDSVSAEAPIILEPLVQTTGSTPGARLRRRWA